MLGMHFTCLRSFEGALLGENCPGTAFSLVMLRRGTRGFTVFDDEFPESEILRGGLELAPTGFRAFVMLVMFESFFLSGLPPCCCCFRPPALPIIGIIPPLACILPALGVQTCQSLSKSFEGDVACNKHNRNLAKVTCEYMKNGQIGQNLMSPKKSQQATHSTLIRRNFKMRMPVAERMTSASQPS